MEAVDSVSEDRNSTSINVSLSEPTTRPASDLPEVFS